MRYEELFLPAQREEKVKKKYTIIKFKVDRVRLEDLDRILEELCFLDVPDNASISIHTDGTGTHVTAEWAELEVPKPEPLSKDKWVQSKFDVPKVYKKNPWKHNF